MYRMKGRLDDGQSFNLALGNAPNFMAALSAAGKILADNLKERAGAVTRFTIASEDEAQGFKLRTPKKKKEGASNAAPATRKR